HNQGSLTLRQTRWDRSKIIRFEKREKLIPLAAGDATATLRFAQLMQHVSLPDHSPPQRVPFY
ncbi:MAG: hypothetical protein RSB48_04100, partial [Akkermansia sp.]